MGHAPKHVLVVDDERHIARLVEVNLQRQGYHVTVAVDRDAAWHAVNDQPPDIILLDIQISDGFRLLEELKAEKRTRKIPILMLSPKTQGADVFRGWRNGWQDLDPFDDDSDEDEDPQ